MRNDVCTADGVSFRDTSLIYKTDSAGPSPIFPRQELIGPAYELQEDGSVLFSLYYPKAKSVRLVLIGTKAEELLLKQEGSGRTDPPAPPFHKKRGHLYSGYLHGRIRRSV